MTDSAAPVIGVGAICVQEGRLLLVRRGRGWAAGTWAVPGGRLELGETLAQGVERELFEETGLRGRATHLCGIAERFGSGHHFVILDYWCEVEAGEAVAGDDAAEVVWASRADLRQLPLVERLEQFLHEHGVLDRLR